MNDNKESLTLIMERSLFEKYKYIAEHNGNSFDEEIEKGIEEMVRDFEKEHGKILLVD